MKTQVIEVKDEIRSVINEIIQNPSDRADVYQNTCMNLFVGFTHYKETGHLSAWARTIARHECMNYYRNQEKKKNILSEYRHYLNESELKTEIDEVDPKLIAREILDSFKELCNKMDDHDTKTIIIRAYFNEELNINQISKKYDLSRKTVSRIVKENFIILKSEFEKVYAEFSLIDNHHIN